MIIDKFRSTMNQSVSLAIHDVPFLRRRQRSSCSRVLPLSDSTLSSSTYFCDLQHSRQETVDTKGPIDVRWWTTKKWPFIYRIPTYLIVMMDFPHSKNHSCRRHIVLAIGGGCNSTLSSSNSQSRWEMVNDDSRSTTMLHSNIPFRDDGCQTIVVARRSWFVSISSRNRKKSKASKLNVLTETVAYFYIQSWSTV
jgi:hypothetical protein